MLEPKIGDIISFEHARGQTTVSPDRSLVTRAGTPPFAHCALDTRVMQASGGSIVIEALLLSAAGRQAIAGEGRHSDYLQGAGMS